jgi:hypothetical protein
VAAIGAAIISGKISGGSMKRRPATKAEEELSRLHNSYLLECELIHRGDE